jgi:outer membrane autotransporter protein
VSAQGNPAVDGFASGFALWGQAFGSFGDFRGDAHTASLDRSSRGFVFGADYGQGPWRVGLVAGYTQTTLDQSGLSASANLDTYYVGAYGGFSFNGFDLKVGGLYTAHDIETNRSVAFSDYRDRLGANFNAQGWQLFGEVGYTFQVGQVSLQPFAGLTYVHVESDGFLEEGGPAALMSEGMSRSFGYSTLGLRASTEVAVGNTTLGLHGMIGWRHAFADESSFATLAFRDWCLPFRVAGVPVARDSLVVEAGLDWKIGPQAKLGVSYSGVIARDAQDHAFKADLTIRF